jgi:hypothetical protein
MTYHQNNSWFRTIASITGLVLTLLTANLDTMAQNAGANLNSQTDITYAFNSFYVEPANINSPTAGQWIPDRNFNIFTSSNGIVYTAGTAEYGPGCIAIENGNFVAQYANGTGDGYGDPSSQVTANSTYVWRATDNGVLQFPIAGASSPNLTALTGDIISGIALYNGNLYASDITNNKIRVLNATTLAENTSAEWSVTNPGPIAIDSTGKLWVIQYANSASSWDWDNYNTFHGTKILSYTISSKAAGATITALADIRAIAVDSSNNLYAGGRTTDQQVHKYNSGGTQIGTFGTTNGIFSGTAGQYAPLKFHWITGLGVDSSGNIYVANLYGTGTYSTEIEAYSSSGSQLWTVGGYEFESNATFDPSTDGQDAYDPRRHFGMNYSNSDGKQWSLSGMTTNDIKYPNDPRVAGSDAGQPVGNQFDQSVAIRNLNGNKLLYTTDQNSGSAKVYELDANLPNNGQVFRPVITFENSGNNDVITFYNLSGNVSGTQTVLANNDGQGHDGFYGHIDVTSEGDVLRIENGIVVPNVILYPYTGVDGNNTATFNTTSSTTWAFDPSTEFNGNYDLERVTYDKPNDVMYVGAFNNDTDQDGGFSVVARYNNWSGANGQSRSQAWVVQLPYDSSSFTPNYAFGDGAPEALRIAGSYLFINYGYGNILVLNQSDGSSVGTIYADRTSGADEDDAEGGLNVMQRADGQYVMLAGNVARNNDTLIIWTPPGSTMQAAVPTFSPGAGTYSSAQTVTLSDSTNGATIYYTTNGTTPTTSSTKYTGAISVTASETLKAIATATGYSQSNVGSASFTISGGTEAAYKGPHNIPGTVQAEDYDTGGQGVAYNQTSTGGGSGYRTDNSTAVEANTADSNGYDVGWTASGQWYKYTVVVGTAGSYTVSFSVASPNGQTGAFHLQNSSGTNLSGSVNVPNTSGWYTWQSVTATVTLPAGTQTLEIVQDNGGWNLDSFSFASNGGTQVSLTGNTIGIYTDGSTFSSTGGVDADGHAYSANLLGTSLTYSGVKYTFGTANQKNVITATSSPVVTLTSGSYSTLNLLGTGYDGNQASQVFKVTYTDGSTTQFTQSLSDWWSPSGNSGESQALQCAYIDTSSGTKQTQTVYLYQYSFALNSAKTVKSLTLPNNSDVLVFAVTLR